MKKKKLSDFLKTNKVNLSRIFFIKPLSRENYLNYFNLVDINLDTFPLEFLFREIEQAAGGSKEEWTAEFNTEERECFKTGEPPCLPRAIQLSMSLQGASGEIVSDSQVINLCVRPCKPELFE